MAIQNLAGRRALTPTDDILVQIRDAILSSQIPQAPASGQEIAIGLSLGDPFYVGSHMRFVALSNGASLEILNTSNVWVEQTRWTES